MDESTRTAGVNYGERASSPAGQSLDPHAGGTPAPHMPCWQQLSGLTPEAEKKMSRSERRYALRKLYKKFDALAREALGEHAADPEKDERSYLWDPVAMICVELGIARSKLSALTREHTGMSAHDIVDRARAETIKPALEENVTRFFDGRITPGRKLEQGYWSVHLLKCLKSARLAGGFDNVQWALRHGFANYARFRRGCMLAHGGKSPQVIEREWLGELADYYWLAESLNERQKWQAPIYFINRIGVADKPWNDEWARAMNERGEWLAQMKAKLGLKESLAELGAQTHHPPLDDEQKAYLKRTEERKAEEEAREKTCETGVEPREEPPPEAPPRRGFK